METIRQTLNTRGSTFYSELFTSFTSLEHDSVLSLQSLSHAPSNEVSLGSAADPFQDPQVFGSFMTSRACPLKSIPKHT